MSKISPLSGFRAYEERSAADQAQLRVSGLPAGGFVRIATLDTYDGVVFRVGGSDGASGSGTFQRVPTSVDVRGVQGETVRVGVTVDGYRGVWLPTVGDLERARHLLGHSSLLWRLRRPYSNPTVATAGAESRAIKKAPLGTLARTDLRGMLSHVANAPTYYENECPHGTAP